MKVGEGRWKGTVEVRCPSCCNTEPLQVTVQPGQVTATMDYTCPFCDARQTVRVNRLQMDNVQIRE